MSYLARAALCKNILAKKLFELMDKKQTNLSLSADVTDAQTLLQLADLLGPEICVLKTHIDIIQDFTPALTKKLRHLADKHDFLLFEDRKFADIGQTVKHQYENGIYQIADWADIINAHALPGPGIVQGLAQAGHKKNRGLLLIAEMSSQGHLFTPAYMDHTLKMAEQFSEFVIGFITQHAISSNQKWINMTPGVQLEAGKDGLGQQYTTPHDAIVKNGADIIIVGRGITQAKEPLAMAKQYRIAGWDAYLKRTNI